MKPNWIHVKILAVAFIVLGISACSEGEDIDLYNQKMFDTSISSFTTSWINKHAQVRSVPVSTVDMWWDMGSGLLDTQQAKNYWFDMSTDFCSNSLDTGFYFDFKAPCTRHDFGWRNLKKLDRHWNCLGSQANKPCGSNGLSEGESGGYWNYTNRLIVNGQFSEDMNFHCAGRSMFYRPACYHTAETYFLIVNVAAMVG
jgi:hypothetical protein